MKHKRLKVLSFLMTLIMILSLLPMTKITSHAENGKPISHNYGNDYLFEKVSNPASASKEPDGINTNDETGFGANRLNSYAWAVAARGDYIYIGTNRTLFGSSVNSVTKAFKRNYPDSTVTREQMNKAVNTLSQGDVPVNLKDEDYVPQIIRFDVKKGTTKVIYQPSTKRDTDGVLYYTDKDGNIVQNANGKSDVLSETLSYRSVVEYKGNLYFGSLGVNMLQLIRVDENDNAEVVHQTLGQISSLRAGCVYDAGDGKGDVLYFGGQDTTYPKWQKLYMQYKKEGKDLATLPIVIRYLNPETAGTNQEDWSGLVADYEDFGKYAEAIVYKNGGGNVWDLISYNGKLYLILAYDEGWAMFRGEKGGKNPNSFGWTWTEVVGDNGKYPLAMDAKIGQLNREYKEKYSCHNYSSIIHGAGLLDSTATPYVYKGKMYIGSFDNATAIQSETISKLLAKAQCMLDIGSGDWGPSLEQIFAPIYYVLSHPQQIYVMDENEDIKPVEGANDLLKGTTNDYVWRFVEHDGKLYTGTFDSSTAYNYYVNMDLMDFLNAFISTDEELSQKVKELLNGTAVNTIRALAEEEESELEASADEADPEKEEFIAAVKEACDSLEAFNNKEADVKSLIPAIENLQARRDAFVEAEAEADDEEEEDEITAALVEYVKMILDFYDTTGLGYWEKTQELIDKAHKGFDLFVTEDGNKWERILDDGLMDPYNYGGRTLTIFNDEIYIGTANPYYGAQLWRVKDLSKLFIKISTEGEGTAFANPTSGFPGTKVTLTASPANGYQFKEWKVISGNVKIENDQFTLGSSDVEIRAIFEKAANPDSDITFNMKAGDTVTVSKTIGKVKSWTSSNNKIAKVKNGKITALKKGTVTITASLESGDKQTYKVKVTSSPKLSKKKIKIKKGKTVKIKIKGKAPGVKNKYKKSKIAKVISKRTAKTLKIKGLKKGKTKLKIRVNGVTLKLKVTVY